MSLVKPHCKGDSFICKGRRTQQCARGSDVGQATATTAMLALLGIQVEPERLTEPPHEWISMGSEALDFGRIQQSLATDVEWYHRRVESGSQYSVRSLGVTPGVEVRQVLSALGYSDRAEHTHVAPDARAHEVEIHLGRVGQVGERSYGQQVYRTSEVRDDVEQHATVGNSVDGSEVGHRCKPDPCVAVSVRRRHWIADQGPAATGQHRYFRATGQSQDLARIPGSRRKSPGTVGRGYGCQLRTRCTGGERQGHHVIDPPIRIDDYWDRSAHSSQVRRVAYALGPSIHRDHRGLCRRVEIHGNGSRTRSLVQGWRTHLGAPNLESVPWVEPGCLVIALSSSDWKELREKYGALIRQFGKAWEEGNAGEIAALFTETGVLLPEPFGAPLRGRAAIEQYWGNTPAEQAEVSFRFGEIFVAGPWFATEMKCTFRRRRTGQPVDVRGALFCETEGDLIAEMRMYWHRVIG